MGGILLPCQPRADFLAGIVNVGRKEALFCSFAPVASLIPPHPPPRSSSYFLSHCFLRPIDNYRMQMLSFETRHLPHCYIENEDIHSVEFCGFMTRLELISAINPLWDPRAEFLACAKFYASHLFPSSVLKLRLSLGAGGGRVF